MTTRMPPHVMQLREIAAVKQCCIEVKEAVVDLKEEIKTTIHAAIDEN